MDEFPDPSSEKLQVDVATILAFLSPDLASQISNRKSFYKAPGDVALLSYSVKYPPNCVAQKALHYPGRPWVPEIQRLRLTHQGEL